MRGCHAGFCGTSARAEGRLNEGLVFGLGHSIADDQLGLIEGWRVEHVASDSGFLTIYLAFTG
jgi:hypothetical protein